MGLCFLVCNCWGSPEKLEDIFSAYIRSSNTPIKLPYQRMGQAHWGRIRNSWHAVVKVVTHPPKTNLWCEWMEHLISMNMGILRLGKVLVVVTVEAYTTAVH
jgi:hypothetical protein